MKGNDEVTSSKIRRSMPLFPIGPVMQLTELTARQIRYYEEKHLITPGRTKGNQRLFSLNDIDRLLEIKDLLEYGHTMASIQKIFRVSVDGIPSEVSSAKNDLTDEKVRQLLRDEIVAAGRFNQTGMHNGLITFR